MISFSNTPTFSSFYLSNFYSHREDGFQCIYSTLLLINKPPSSYPFRTKKEYTLFNYVTRPAGFIKFIKDKEEAGSFPLADII